MPSRRFDELTDVLGLLYNRKTEDLDAEIEDLIAQRQAARAAKNFAEADRHPGRAEGPGHRAEGYPSGRTVDPYQVIRPENQPDIKTDRVCRFHREVEQTRSVVFCGAGKQCGLVRCMAVPFQCDDESVSHRSFPECYCFYDPSVSGVNVHLLLSLFWVFRGDNFIFFHGIHPPYLSFFQNHPRRRSPLG